MATSSRLGSGMTCMAVLRGYGLQKSSYDPCLFFDLSGQIYVTIDLVDDSLVAAKSEVRKSQSESILKLSSRPLLLMKVAYLAI